MVKPVVSVCMIAYNKKQYVAQAIQSVLTQHETPLELIIADDASSDGTTDIIQQYAKQDSRVIHIRNVDNVGPVRNYTIAYLAAQGKYIALLDADDYWDDPRKLVTQVAVMESYPEFSATFHNARIYDERSGAKRYFHSSPAMRIWTYKDLLTRYPIPTCTVMYRRIEDIVFPDWFFRVGTGDYPLHLLHARRGDVCYIDKVMAVYRRHDGGYWTTMSSFRKIQETINMQMSVLEHEGGSCARALRSGIYQNYYALFRMALEDGHVLRSLHSLLRCICTAPLSIGLYYYLLTAISEDVRKGMTLK